MRQIHRKHPKFIDKLIVYKFTDGFLSPSIIINGFLSLSVITDGFLSPLVITDGFLSPSVIINRFRVNLSVNPSINLTTDDIR